MSILQGDYDAIVKDTLQAKEVNRLISDRESIKEEIFTALASRPINIGGPTLSQKYGIEVVSFVLKETHFGEKLVEATEEKKRRELIAEAENYAADQEASRIRKLYAAYLESIQALQKSLGRPDGATDKALLEFLTQQKWASAYEKNQSGQNTVVIQNTQIKTLMGILEAIGAPRSSTTTPSIINCCRPPTTSAALRPAMPWPSTPCRPCCTCRCTTISARCAACHRKHQAGLSVDLARL